MQTVWSQIRLLIQEKSYLGLHCLAKRPSNDFNCETTKQTTRVVNGALRVFSSMLYLEKFAIVLYDLLVTVKAAPHEYVIMTDLS